MAIARATGRSVVASSPSALPMTLSIPTAGTLSAVPPSGSPSTARRCCSCWVGLGVGLRVRLGLGLGLGLGLELQLGFKVRVQG